MKRSSFFKTTQQLQALNERENASSLIHTKAQVKLQEDVTQAIEFPWAPFSARKGNHFLYVLRRILSLAFHFLLREKTSVDHRLHDCEG